MSMPTTEQVSAALTTITAVADTIRELGEVPSGHLYAQLLGTLDIEQYQKIIALLKRAELVSDKGSLLKWIGPKKA